MKKTSYQCRKSHCGDKTILRPSHLHNYISYTGKMTSLYWIRALIKIKHVISDLISRLDILSQGFLHEHIILSIKYVSPWMMYDTDIAFCVLYQYQHSLLLWCIPQNCNWKYKLLNKSLNWAECLLVYDLVNLCTWSSFKSLFSSVSTHFPCRFLCAVLANVVSIW